MTRKIVALLAIAIGASSCVTLPHSAHPIGPKPMEKPTAPKEKIEIMIPVEGGIGFYNLSSSDFFDEPTMLDEISLRNYFGEAGVSFSKKIGAAADAKGAFSGGASFFTYSGRSIGSEEAEEFGIDVRQDLQGNGGRLNLSFDLNYDLGSSAVCWRVFNAQLSYAAESGGYSNYRQVAIDSSAGRRGFSSSDNEYRVVQANSDFLSSHFYTEVILNYEDFGFSFALGGINYYSQTELDVWESYMFSPTFHLGFNFQDFYIRFNLGNFNPSSSIFGGTSNRNLLLGYRVRL